MKKSINPDRLELLKKEAIKQAISAKSDGTLLFDPQGRVLIALSQNVPDGKEITVSLDAFSDIQLKDEYKKQYRLDKLNEQQLEQFEAIRGSIIPLKQEFHFHLALAARVYQTTLKNKHNGSLCFKKDDISSAHQKSMQILQPLIQEEFANALKKATTNGVLHSELLIKELDKSRKTLTASAHKILLNQILELEQSKISINDVSWDRKEMKHTAETTAATDNDLLHIDSSLNLNTFISGSSVTAHNRGFGKEHLADREISTESGRLRIRTPSLDVKEDGVTLDKAAEDVANKLDALNNKYDIKQYLTENKNNTIKAFTYNLHTAINYNETLDGKNKQSQGAKVILMGSHQYNADQQNNENPVYCFVQNISVNGFGDSLGYSGNELRSEATLMTELSMLHHLATTDKEQKQTQFIFKQYQEYLKKPNREDFFSQSDEGKNALEQIKEIKNLWQQKNNRPQIKSEQSLKEQNLEKAKNALRAMMAHNLHHDHRYAKMIQALSIFIEEASISGCKSANERAQSINGRIAILDSEVNNETSTLFGIMDKFAHTTEDPKGILIVAEQLKTQLDSQYDKHLQSAASLISLIDQGASAKVKPKEGFKARYDTNYAEDELPHLSQDKAGEMQAHKGLTQNMEATLKQKHQEEHSKVAQHKIKTILKRNKQEFFTATTTSESQPTCNKSR